MKETLENVVKYFATAIKALGDDRINSVIMWIKIQSLLRKFNDNFIRNTRDSASYTFYFFAKFPSIFQEK